MTANPFTAAYAPATIADQQYQPTMQDISAQNAFTRQAMQQGMQLAQDASRTVPTSGPSPSALAQALRANKGAGGQMPWYQQAAAVMGSTPSEQLQQNVTQLGSNTWNPWSDYNTGANGWGSFGE